MKTSELHTIYDNPLPQLRARNSCFPGVCRLKDGRLLAIHVISQAFESVDATSCVSFSEDEGATWTEPRQIFDKTGENPVMSDCCKPTQLPDGRIVLLGYQYFRENEDLPLGNALTGGLLDDEILFSCSTDGGKTFTPRQKIPCAWGNHVEASAPIYVLKDGSWATPITGFPDWNGNMTGKRCGRLLRSYDEGKTWNDDTVCMEFPGNTVLCYEQRLCQLANGDLVVIGWNENAETGERLNNHITVSTDNGKTFSAPIDTGVRGQASSIIAIGGQRVLSMHAVRKDTEEVGIYACIAEVKDGAWKKERCERVWAPNAPMRRVKGMAEIFSMLKFGQPGALLLSEGRALVFFWMCEEGVYKTCCFTLEF